MYRVSEEETSLLFLWVSEERWVGMSVRDERGNCEIAEALASKAKIPR